LGTFNSAFADVVSFAGTLDSVVDADDFDRLFVDFLVESILFPLKDFRALVFVVEFQYAFLPLILFSSAFLSIDGPEEKPNQPGQLVTSHSRVLTVKIKNLFVRMKLNFLTNMKLARLTYYS
jgi:hypothetical protein